MNEHAYATNEHARMIASVVMVGVVAELDEEGDRIRVDVDDMTTDWIAWASQRSADDADYWAPEPGEQVVMVCPYGDPSQGVVIGSIPQQAYPATPRKRGVWQKRFKDGTSFTYDRSAHTLTVDTTTQGGITIICNTATVKAEESVTIDTPSTKLTGDLEVGGNTVVKGNTDVQGSTSVKAITSNGVDISSTHVHPGVQSGPAKTAPPG